MKLLSLWQPWATLMAVGAKRVETRSWSTSYRGLVAIHAAKHWTIDEKFICTAGVFRGVLRDAGYPHPVELPLGAIVAVGQLVDCLPTQPGFTSVFEQWPRLDTPQERAFGNYDGGRFGWVFVHVKRLKEPMAYKGAQGLRDLPDEVAHALQDRW